MATEVPTLARMHLALGAADAGVPAPPPSRTRQVLAVLAALLLGLGSALWCAGPAAAAADQPAATLPDDHADADGTA
jgi:hypothetical protein